MSCLDLREQASKLVSHLQLLYVLLFKGPQQLLLYQRHLAHGYAYILDGVGFLLSDWSVELSHDGVYPDLPLEPNSFEDALRQLPAFLDQLMTFLDSDDAVIGTSTLTALIVRQQTFSVELRSSEFNPVVPPEKSVEGP